MSEQDPLLHPESVEDAPRPGRRWLQVVFYLLAIALLVACIWFGYGEFQNGMDKLRRATAGDLTLMLGMVVGNIVFDGVMFWLVLIPFRPAVPVPVTRMVALIGATSLLNYLPMRAGMIGRAAYLKQRHGVRFRASVVMLLAVASATMVIYTLLGALAWALDGLTAAWWAGSFVGLGVLSWAGVWVARHGRRWMPRSVLRYFDDAQTAIGWLGRHPAGGVLGAWGVVLLRALAFGTRVVLLWAAARVLGTPIDGSQALWLGIVGTFVTLASPLPNGLGLREWAYGVLGASGIVDGGMELALALGFVERAIEAAVFIVAGTGSLLYLQTGERGEHTATPGG